MSYDYKIERAKVFTEDGQVMFLAIRDRTKELLKQAGACRSQEMMGTIGGDSWTMLACIDRMVEIGELRELTLGQNVAAQRRIFTAP